MGWEEEMDTCSVARLKRLCNSSFNDIYIFLAPVIWSLRDELYIYRDSNFLGNQFEEVEC